MNTNTQALREAQEKIVYDILCSDEEPPNGRHWEGFLAERIVAALSHLPAPEQASGDMGYQEAWVAVCNALDEVNPEWTKLGETGIESACIAIKALASTATPTAEPAGEAFEDYARSVGMNLHKNIDGSYSYGQTYAAFKVWKAALSQPPAPEAAKPEQQADPLQKLTRLTEEMGLYPWQAQAGEPEVVAFIEHHKGGDNLLWDCPGGKYSELITLQSHREALQDQTIRYEKTIDKLNDAIAKKDAALNACVDALKKAAINDPLRGDVYYDAAITQAEGAMK